jgi:hypothetical protein
MWIKDLFSNRKPNHLVIYINYKNLEVNLYKFLNMFTYGIKPYKTMDETIEGVRKFIKKHPHTLKDIIITSYGTGKKLIESTESNEKFEELINTLKPLMDENTKITFTTCFSGISHRKVVEFSEHLNGREILAMNGNYGLNNKVISCKCKQKGYSESVIKSLKQSKNGLRYDEVAIVGVVRRKEGEEINWLTSGMAFEYNERVKKEGICFETKQSRNAIKCMINYLFNIQD